MDGQGLCWRCSSSPSWSGEGSLSSATAQRKRAQALISGLAVGSAYALVALDHQIDFDTALMSMLGIIGIGSVNLLVSFGLALFVALKSRRARFNQKGAFVREMARRFVRKPGQFFLPPHQAHRHHHPDAASGEPVTRQ